MSAARLGLRVFQGLRNSSGNTARDSSSHSSLLRTTIGLLASPRNRLPLSAAPAAAFSTSKNTRQKTDATSSSAPTAPPPALPSYSIGDVLPILSSAHPDFVVSCLIGYTDNSSSEPVFRSLGPSSYRGLQPPYSPINACVPDSTGELIISLKKDALFNQDKDVFDDMDLSRGKGFPVSVALTPSFPAVVGFLSLCNFDNNLIFRVSVKT